MPHLFSSITMRQRDLSSARRSASLTVHATRSCSHARFGGGATPAPAACHSVCALLRSTFLPLLSSQCCALQPVISTTVPARIPYFTTRMTMMAPTSALQPTIATCASCAAASTSTAAPTLSAQARRCSGRAADHRLRFSLLVSLVSSESRHTR